MRAVGTACATNPLPVVVPCHRVLRADGTLSGYVGGAAARQALLSLEAAADDHRDRTSWRDRVESGDWAAITAEVNALGGALLPELLTPAEAAEIRGLYPQAECFRATINMGAAPVRRGRVPVLQDAVPGAGRAAEAGAVPAAAADRQGLVGQARPASPVAGHAGRVAADVPRGRARTKSTAILLRYQAGDWNALHRDLYGDLVFPLQVVVNLNEPGGDHSGGEFLLMEQRPRAQSRGTATLLPHCRGYVFTTRDRPVRSARGWSAAPVRHGVSVIRSGQRHTLGLVFHDAS